MLFNKYNTWHNACNYPCGDEISPVTGFIYTTRKMDGANPKATTVEEYMKGTPAWRTDLYVQNGTLMTHAESAALFKAHGVKVTPELKSAAADMPFNGFT